MESPVAGDYACVVGITGGIGVGKSTLAEAFAQRGAHIIGADEIGHDVLRDDDEVQHRLAEAFGPDVLGPDGQLDRGLLGARVFGDGKAMTTLNRIVHPPLLKLLKNRMDAAQRDLSVSLVVVDAALITEWGIASWFDLLIVVTAPATHVRKRLTAKDLSPDQIDRRIASQLPEDARTKEADVVIHNNGDIAAIDTAVEEIWRRFRRA